MIQLLEALVRECHKPRILEYLTDLDWDCFHFFRMHKMLMGYLAAGPGKEGFNAYTFSDRVPINSHSDAQKYLASLQKPPITNRLARWSTQGGGAENLVVCPI